MRPLLTRPDSLPDFVLGCGGPDPQKGRNPDAVPDISPVDQCEAVLDNRAGRGVAGWPRSARAKSRIALGSHDFAGGVVLLDDDPRWRRACGERRRGRRQLREVIAMNRESADRASRAVDDPEGPAVGAQACILCSRLTGS